MPGNETMHTSSRSAMSRRASGTWAAFIALLGLAVLLLAGCRKDSSDIAPPTGGGGGGSVYTDVVGLVTELDGTPVAGASITCGGKSAVTDVAGAFMIRNVGTDGRCYAHATKTGFFPGSAGVPAKVNGVSRVRITLLPDAPVTTFSAGMGTDYSLSGGARVVIGGNSVVDGSGNPYSGSVSLAVRHLDPDAPEFPAIMPAGDLVAVGSTGDDVQLISYGMMMLRLTDGGGNELQLASGSSAEITMPLPGSLTAGAPQEMPLWHFNEDTGKWEQEGMMQLEGGAYVATVSHFSSWNADWPTDRGTVRGLVLDCNGDPVEGVVVRTGQSTAMTDAQGRYERYVPTGVPVEVRVDDPALGLSSETRMVDPLSDGQDVSVGDLHLTSCPGFVEYTLTCASGSPMGYVTLSWPTGSAVRHFNAPGTYRLAVPHSGASAQLRVVHGNGAPTEAQVNLPSAAGGTVQAGSFAVCAQGGGSYGASYTIHGDGHNNETVTISTSGVTAYAIYSPTDSTTVGYASQQIGQWFSVAFPGNTTGTWNMSDGASDALLTLYLGGNTYISEDFTLQVTSYGGVGQNVTGTFSGTFVRFDMGTLEEVPVTVSNGQFQLLRNPDQD